MKKLAYAILVVAVVLTAALAGCTPAPTAAPTQAPPPTTAPAATVAPTVAPTKAPTVAPTAAPAKAGGQIIVGHGQEPDRLWGPFTGLSVAQEVGCLINLPLLVIDDKLNYVPRLLTRVPTTENGDISKDGLSITFKLRNDVKWHDGKPFTSKDVKFTWQVIMMKDTDVKGRVGWTLVTDVQTPDDTTAIFKFSAIDAAFLNRITWVGMLPEHILGGKSAAEINKDPWFRAPVGTGPFKFKEWVAGDHITMVKNPDYFEKGKPGVDTLIWKIVPDANSLVNQLQTGDVDIALRLNNTLAATVDGFQNVTRVSSSTVTPWLIWLNNLKPGLDDKAVRQALSYAIDRDGITSKLLKGLVQPAYGYVPPTSWAFNPNAAKYAFDLDKAAKMLDDAGWKLNADGVREKSGVKLSYKIVNIAGEQERVQILTAIIANWKKIGVNAEIELVDVGKMWGDLLPNKTFEMGYSYSGMTADPDISNMFYCPANSPVSNYASYCNADVDAAIKAELSTFDQALRKDALWKAQAQIALDVPYLYLSWRADHTGVNKRVKGYLPCPGYIELWNAADWTVQ